MNFYLETLYKVSHSNANIKYAEYQIILSSNEFQSENLHELNT